MNQAKSSDDTIEDIVANQAMDSDLHTASGGNGSDEVSVPISSIQKMQKVFDSLHTHLPLPLVHHIAGYASNHRQRWQHVMHELWMHVDTYVGEATCECCRVTCTEAKEECINGYTYTFCSTYCAWSFECDYWRFY